MRTKGTQIGDKFMKEIKEQIQQVIIEIDELTNELYKQKISMGYNMLNITLGHVMNILEDVFLYRKDHEILYDENKMTSNLKLAMDAMENKDSVLLADIMKYEVAEQLQELESCFPD